VVFSQNHDQVGNRAAADRLNATVGFEGLKVSTAAVLLSPFIPLLFMGQEYGETAPFNYFVDHEDADLLDAVRKGRQAEFSGFEWKESPPDPASMETFHESRLDHSLKNQSPHREILALTRQLLDFRRDSPLCGTRGEYRQRTYPFETARALVVHRWDDRGRQLLLAFAFSTAPQEIVLSLHAANYRLALNSTATQWAGPGADVPGQLSPAQPATLRLPPLSALIYTEGSESP
jgi:maltooligosyltrehalose trehalohydrolase